VIDTRLRRAPTDGVGAAVNFSGAIEFALAGYLRARGRLATELRASDRGSRLKLRASGLHRPMIYVLVASTV